MIEKELFGSYSIDEKKLREYGFQPDGSALVYAHELPKENFRIVITYDRAFSGKIIDLAFGEEYVNFRMEAAAGFSAGIRQKYEALLLDIRDKCCKYQYFRTGQARRINEYIYETYDVMPEFLWPNIPSYAAFRRKQGGKWFAVIGSVPRCKVDPLSASAQDVEVINVKAGKAQIGTLLARDGIYPAFHMNKNSWVSIIFDDTLPDADIRSMVDESYESL
ncbi:MAG: MmcQ/YjbR family DNA-binding protein [Clostridiales bacterium]|nr:MmcQ/YjbR family DNA-binding protein [Clostridiales bacterium]